ncbi:H-type lectin domain-containing protein [Lentibacter algarum]|uniref:H-type lectin domain-containing protein n=1 Tax=Lentibacter algarum TaxID=576131 RepID=UPI001C065695|nr:H-type lectin domain-containing protein [Lentibacter algarum]MBU2980958.1 H-type lectin domain-containing protein [Lentibacter algarum]
MKKLGVGVGVAQGNDVIFEHYQEGGEMWTGTGNREARKWIAFQEPFKSAPSVQCSLTLWDVDSATNLRADIEAENIGETGFHLVFRTWGDSKIARIRASWLAIGSVPDDDAWEVY